MTRDWRGLRRPGLVALGLYVGAWITLAGCHALDAPGDVLLATAGLRAQRVEDVVLFRTS